MSPAELLEALVGLCRDAGLEVRSVRRSSEAASELVARSGVCRVRGALWLVLSDADGVEDRMGPRPMRCGRTRQISWRVAISRRPCASASPAARTIS